MGESDLKNFKTEFSDNMWKYLTEKLAKPYEYSNSLHDYQKPVDNLKKEDFFSMLNKDYPGDIEIKRTKKFSNCSILKMGKI